MLDSSEYSRSRIGGEYELAPITLAFNNIKAPPNVLNDPLEDPETRGLIECAVR